jgi:hypothetical protein
VAECCEHGDECPSFINCGEVFEERDGFSNKYASSCWF